MLEQRYTCEACASEKNLDPATQAPPVRPIQAGQCENEKRHEHEHELPGRWLEDYRPGRIAVAALKYIVVFVDGFSRQERLGECEHLLYGGCVSAIHRCKGTSQDNCPFEVAGHGFPSLTEMRLHYKRDVRSQS